MDEKPIIGIIGAGKVATVLTRLMVQSGYVIGAVYNRTTERAHVLANQVDSIAVASPEDVIAHANLIVIGVTDDAIQSIADRIAGQDWQGKAVVHLSGALSAQALMALKSAGAEVGSLHPALPFADVDTPLESVRGAVVAVEAETSRLQSWLMAIVTACGARPIVLSTEQKARYHAALVIASNYTVTLYAIAQDLLTQAGADADTAQAALNPLLSATVDNLRVQGLPQALTGPLVRSDVGTISAHLHALAETPEIAGLYRSLARATYPLLHARGVSIDLIEETLRQDEP